MKRRVLSAALFGLVLRFSAWSVGAVEAPETLTQVVSDGTVTLTLNLVRESLRGPHFRVLVQTGADEWSALPPPEVRTYVGTVVERPDAVVSGFLEDDGRLSSRIYLDRGARWTALGAALTVAAIPESEYAWPGTASVVSGSAGRSVWRYSVGVDVDRSACDLGYGGDVAATIAGVEKNMVALRVMHLRDCMLLPELSWVLVRASSPDCPYRDTTGTALLRVLRDEWQTRQAAALADSFRVLLVSANIGGGVANRPGVWSVAQCRRGGWFMLAARHELGHNFGAADHEAGNPEGRTIMCGNSISRFCGPTVRQHLAHRERSTAATLVNTGAPYRTVNIPPYAALDAADAVVHPGDSVTFTPLANDFDANDDALTLAAVEGRSKLGGTAVVHRGSGDPAGDQVVYTASTDPAGVGLDSFHYTVRDQGGKVATGLAVVLVTLRPPEPLWRLAAAADAFVRGTDDPANYGAEEQLVIKRSSAGAASGYTRTAWINFDVAGKTFPGPAALTFQWASGDAGSGSITVWGIVDGAPGDVLGRDWTESGITGANAPVKPDFTNAAGVVKLGSFGCAPPPGGRFRFSSPALDGFLREDTNGQVTVLLTRDVNNGDFALRARESGVDGPMLSAVGE